LVELKKCNIDTIGDSELETLLIMPPALG